MKMLAGLFTVLMLAATSCVDEPPKRFSKNEPIPLGSNTIKIVRIETGMVETDLKQLAQSSPELATLSKSGKTSAGVIFEIAGIGTANAQDQTKEREKIVPRGQVFTLVDKAGVKFDSVAVFPEYMLLHDDPAAAFDQMFNTSADSQTPRRYIALFLITKESSGFTLLIRNPATKDGQPQLASVSLGK